MSSSHQVLTYEEFYRSARVVLLVILRLKMVSGRKGIMPRILANTILAQ